jgi:protein SCO1/2
LKQVKAQLGDEAKRLKILFLSVDAEHDNPAQLAQYVHHFDPEFQAATGTAAQLAQFAQELGLTAMKTSDAENGTYAIDHSARLILLNPAGARAASLAPPFSPADLVADFKQVLQSR